MFYCFKETLFSLSNFSSQFPSSSLWKIAIYFQCLLTSLFWTLQTGEIVKCDILCTPSYAYKVFLGFICSVVSILQTFRDLNNIYILDMSIYQLINSLLGMFSSLEDCEYCYICTCIWTLLFLYVWVWCMYVLCMLVLFYLLFYFGGISV